MPISRSRLFVCLSVFAVLAVSPALASVTHHAKRSPRQAAAGRWAAARHHGDQRTSSRGARRRRHPARAAATRHRPRITAAPASAITTSAATLNGSVNPGGYATTYYFQYGTSTSYGSSTAALSVGSGSTYVAVSAPLSNLNPSTRYHYRLVAKNSGGTTYGSDTAFTTSAIATSAPSVTTGAASAIFASSATLNGTVNPNGAATSYYYQYGQTNSYGSATAVLSAGSGSGAAQVPLTLTGLQASTAYHFRIVASNSAGTSYGPDQTFLTSAATQSSSYDQVVLGDHPVAYYDMSGTTSESDVTGGGHTGTYKGGAPAAAALPNGDRAADFNTGSSHSGQYVTIPSSSVFSIPTTRQLTWEAWIRPDVLQFAHPANSDQYVDWMGKCQDYSPTCEWEARFYSAQTPESRPDRISAYVFKPSAGLGSAADWQPASGVIAAGEWLHVVGEYQTLNTPPGCNSAYPGTINIWVNGVEQSFASHAPTGCMSQYNIVPTAGSSPVNIGTMGLDSWFQGAVGKVAVYDSLLTQAQISAHFQAMTGAAPSGSCANTCTVP